MLREVGIGRRDEYDVEWPLYGGLTVRVAGHDLHRRAVACDLGDVAAQDGESGVGALDEGRRLGSAQPAMSA